MDIRWVDIVKILYYEDRYISIKQLANELKLSSKTIEKIIETNKIDSKNHGFHLDFQYNLGYKITIEETNLFHKFIYEATTLENNMNDERISIIIKKLVGFKDYIKIEVLADELYVSRATIDRLMPMIKNRIKKYDLSIVTKPKYGIKIKGKEINMRICIAHISHNKDFNRKEATEIVQKTIIEVIEKYNLILNDINFYNLIQHCVISIDRIKSNNIMENKFIFDQKKDIENEKNAAKEIAEKFENYFRIKIPDSERQYIVVHLLGKRLQNNVKVSEEVLAFVDDVLESIYEFENIDLRYDQELKTALSIHIQPLLSRLKFGLKQENPNLIEIKRDMRKGYDIAAHTAIKIYDAFNLKVNEDEIAYLALHYSVSLDQQKKSHINKKILLVCSSGMGTAKLLQHKLVERYHFKQENLVLVSSLILDNYDFSNVHCILTTIPLDIQVNIPIILIDLIFSERIATKVDKVIKSVTLISELEKIVDQNLFFQKKKFNFKEEVLKFMCVEVAKTSPVNDDFFNQIIARENISSTEVGNGVALPHPYIYQGKQVILSVVSLDRPIKWKFANVQLIILLAIPNENSIIYDQISDLITDIISNYSKVNELIFNTQKEKLLEIAKGE